MGSTSMTPGKPVMASPPEFAITYNSFASPAPTHTRYNSSEPSPNSYLSSDKMGVSPRALGPPKNMASLLSPPPSPYERALPAPPASSPTPVQTVDPPIYYSSPSSPAIPHEASLFPEAEPFDDIISSHHASTLHDPRLKPTREEYLVFVSAAFDLCRKNPQHFIERERKYLASVPSQWASMSRVSKKSSALNNRRLIAAAPRTTAPGLSPAKTQQRIARTPKVRPTSSGFDTFVRDANVVNGAASASPRVRASATREDTDFDSIPDMCPPIETLTNPKCLKADWKGTPLDLSKDPHRHLLHPAELHLAATLRLSCASYLTSKRRIFREKIERTRMGLEFRKTDSQKACKIDVNKASKLWAAYDRVGWFDMRFIKPYL